LEVFEGKGLLEKYLDLGGGALKGGASWSVLLARYYQDDHTNQDEVGWGCGIHEREKTYIWGLSGKT